MKAKEKIKRGSTNRISKILVPYDFSKHSLNALLQGISLAKLFMADIELYHCVSPVFIGGNYDFPATAFSFYDDLVKEASLNLNQIAKDAERRHGLNVVPVVEVNTVYQGIIERAEKTMTDLIVMGTHGVSGVKEFFAGSNAFRVVSHSKCPVLTVQNKTPRKIRSIVLPIKAEANTGQKADIVAAMAKLNMARVYIVGFMAYKTPAELKRVKRHVTEVQTKLKAATIDHKTFYVTHDNYAKAIISYAKRIKAGMIAIMTNHEFSLEQVFVGAPAQQFVNHSPIPVLSVPDTSTFEYP